MPGFTFLASPYSHPLAQVRVSRFIAAQDAVIQLRRNNIAVYSPIVHWHHIAMMGELDWTADTFLNQNEPFLDACHTVTVLGIPGWDESRGVQYELQRAFALKKPRFFMSLDWNGEHLEPLL